MNTKQNKKINFRYFVNWFKTLFNEIDKIFPKKERLLFFGIIVIAIIAGFFWIYSYWIKNSKEIPITGGIYTEGIVANSEEDLTNIVNRLTKIGLTKFDDNGNIIAEVASSWEVSENNKQYTFVINDIFSRDDVINILEKQKDKWPGIDIKPQDDNKIVFTFSDSYSPFLASTTDPVLPYGPYILEKSNISEFKFVKNPNYYLQKPYLNEIYLKIFPDKENLQKAYNQSTINGIYKIDDNMTYKGLNNYTIILPRYNILFFNTERDIFKNKDIRAKIKNNEKLDNEISVVLVTLDNEKNHQLVDDLISKWKDLNVKATVFYKTSNEIINDIIPKRDYDLLLYGLDYGNDPDPYPFWHSTQSGNNGLNLSNFSNIDADKALEDARKTLDKNERNKKYEEFWKIFDNEVPAIIISQDKYEFGVSKNIHGIDTGFSIKPEDRFLKINNWYINTKRVKK